VALAAHDAAHDAEATDQAELAGFAAMLTRPNPPASTGPAAGSDTNAQES